jgi:glycosyltransferase involved in cell wall biosynthesis
MRVLLQSRVSLFSGPGGDTVQICKTAEALRALGVICEISTELQPDLSEWDAVHLFNLIRPQEVYLQARNAVRQCKPLALSTIYLCASDYDRSAFSGVVGLVSRVLPPDLFEYAKVFARGVVNREWHDGTLALLRHGYHNTEDRIVRMASVLLPNSHSEMRRVLRDFPVASTIKCVVVPNATDNLIEDSTEDVEPSQFERLQGAVLCVANIAPRKNQLRLVRALKGVNIPLVLVGQPTPNSHGYFEQIKREAGPNVHILGRVSDEEVRRWYRAAKVHVLASWMETTGLSSLEAGLAGCNLVITDKGDTTEYFGDMAFYCDPGSETSIREAVLKAYTAPRCTALQDRIRDKFNWRKTAEATLDAYRQILR